MKLRSSRLADSQLQQVLALIQMKVYKLFIGNLRIFGRVPEDRCVEGRPGIEPTIDSTLIFNAHAPGIDYIVNSFKVS